MTIPKGADDLARLAADYLDDLTHASSRYGRNRYLEPDVAALAGIGYALLALREQLAEQPQPRRRWWHRSRP
jgi:hypothetical protein